MGDDKKAIICCEFGEIIAFLTYRNLWVIQNTIVKFLKKWIDTHSICVSLDMNHNIYLPSIILALKELKIAFIFLKHDEDKIREKLGITWCLSLSSNYYENDVDSVNLNENNELFLSKCENASRLYKNIYYVIRTSGTTGENKFVQVEHYCIESNIQSLSKRFGITADDTIYFGTPLTFDPSMVELLLSLRNNATLLIVPPNITRNPNFLYETLFPLAITVLQMVPSLFARWSKDQIDSILTSSTLKVLAFGGETFPRYILNSPKSEQLRVFNLYGITEVSCWATAYEVDWKEEEIPIGEALDETTVELGENGEIFIGSKTRICYVNGESTKEKLLSTGDNAKKTPTGICYLGRKRDTIKRLGHRVHLIKIEETIRNLTGLENKCVWLEAQSKLLNFIVQEHNHTIKNKIIDKLRVKLMHTLPPYELPDYFEIIRNFPVTSHGKIDKISLEKLYLQRDRLETNPENLFKIILCKYFGELILETSFREMGGNSVLAIQILAEFQTELNHDYPKELVTLLLDSSTETVLNFLSNFNPTRKKIKSKNSQLDIKWSYDLGACVDASPIVFQNKDRALVAVGSFSHFFAILDANNGEEIAKFALPDAIESAACASPCGNFIYVGCFDHKLYCLEHSTKKIKWFYQTEDRIKCQPVIHNNSLIFGSYDKFLHCIDNNEGKIIWKTYTSEGIVAKPLCTSAGNIFTATIGGSCLCLSKAKGEILWKYKTGSPIFGSPCLFNNAIICNNVKGNLIYLSESGEVNWEYSVKGHLFGSLLNHEDYVIFGCSNHCVYIIKIVNHKPELIRSVELSDSISSTPSIADFKGETVVIVVTNDGSLWFINFKKGSVSHTLSLPGQVFSSPFFYEQKVYLGCRDNKLHCIDSK